MTQEHPFAQYIRILGKGKKGSRELTYDEMYDAMSMIMAEKIEPMQLGAFLVLMRYKEETAEEVCASVRAIVDSMNIPNDIPEVDLDWSSYAGKKRVLPLYLLATLAMAESGIRIFMHGASGHTEGRIYTKEVLPQLGIAVATSLDEAADQIQQSNFTYIDLEHLCPKLHEIIELRPYLGLRTPVHTIARMLNPFRAECVMQGIFHPGYRPTHQIAGQMLNIPHLSVIKGDGGEIERNPDTPVLIQSVHNGELYEEEWPAMFDKRHVRSDDLDIEDLKRLWRGDFEDEYSEAAIVGTIAIALYTMGRAADRESAETLATEIWSGRNRSRI